MVDRQEKTFFKKTKLIEVFKCGAYFITIKKVSDSWVLDLKIIECKYFYFYKLKSILKTP